jgi:hypothetical protein
MLISPHHSLLSYLYSVSVRNALYLFLISLLRCLLLLLIARAKRSSIRSPNRPQNRSTNLKGKWHGGKQSLVVGDVLNAGGRVNKRDRVVYELAEGSAATGFDAITGDNKATSDGVDYSAFA